LYQDLWSGGDQKHAVGFTSLDVFDRPGKRAVRKNEGKPKAPNGLDKGDQGVNSRRHIQLI